MLRNRFYYSVKPFIPRALRTALRRKLALRLRHRVMDSWPVMPGSERVPSNWRGWPGGKKFAVVLTHDIEGPRGLERCWQVAECEYELGFRSSFNFIPEGKYRVPAKLRQRLVDHGFEVGVHDLRHDGLLYQSRRDFKRNAERINHYIHQWRAYGFRSGFMLHKLEWLHDLDIRYDMSTFDTDPFEPQPDGRHTIFPFLVRRAEGPNGDSPSSNEAYVELPYTLPQDSTLFLLLRDTSPFVWLRKLDWLAENGGMVLVNSHPDYMCFNRDPRKSMEYPFRHYRELLDYLITRYSGQYWHALPKDVANYMLERPAETAGTIMGNINSADGLAAPQTASVATIPSGTHTRLSDSATDSPGLNGDNTANLAPVDLRRLRGKRGAVLLFSHYPADPRPRRAAEALAAEGVVIDLICLQENTREPQREIINGVNVLRIPLRRRRRGKLSYAWQYSAFIAISFAYLSIRSFARRYDFVHVHNMPDVLVFSAVIPKMFGAKIVLDLHDPMPELMRTIFGLPEHSLSVRALKHLEKRSIAFSSLVLTVNRACRKLYCTRGCPPEKIRIVLNSPDEAVFKLKQPALSNGHDSERFLVLYHGSLVSRNGFDLAVDALAMARATLPRIKLIVCGARTHFFDAVMKSVHERGLEESIEYLGAQNLVQIVAAIDRCHLGIIPNHRNIFTEINTPTRIFEYLALGKPVIAPRASGIRDYFGDEDLIYFELGDAKDLARQIEFAFFHPREVERIVRRGQQVYCSHSWNRQRATLLSAIGELL